MFSFGKCKICHIPLGDFYSKMCCQCWHKSRLIPIEKRFFRHIKKTKKCWIWTSNKNGPYGTISKGGKKGKFVMAHRLSYQIHKGKIPKGKFVLHKCDIPLCVNPKHLYVGTQWQNVQDMINRKRIATGERVGNSKLTEKIVCSIREIYNKENIQIKQVAAMFGTNRETTRQIVRRLTWRHL